MALTTTLPPTPSLQTLPAAPRPEPGPTASLDDRIQAAEARLVRREQDLVLRWQQMSRRVRLSLNPRRWAMPAAVAGVSLLGLWLLLRPSPRPALRRPPSVPRQARARHVSARGRPWWLRALVVAWPMLPERWRGSMSPRTTAAVMGFGLPLAERLLGLDGGVDDDAPLQTMPLVDLRRYAGTWHEIARLPEIFEAGCEGQPRASYSPLPGGELRVVNRCIGKDGALREVEGVARVLPDSGNAKLEVSLWPIWLRWLPMAWAQYWILFVDGDYEVAVVGHPNRRHLWLLSRQRVLAPSQIETLVHIAASQGFPVDKLRFVQPG